VKIVRILLADGYPHFTQLEESFLDSSFEVVGKMGDGRALLDAAVKLKPDVILTAISMPILNGIEAANRLRESGCTSRVVFVTVHEDADFIRACLAAGAVGFVSKQRIATDLLPAIQDALAGHIFISPMSMSATC